MPKEQGNHNGVSRHKQLAQPAEYLRWCWSHVGCVCDILASVVTDIEGRQDVELRR